MNKFTFRKKSPFYYATTYPASAALTITSTNKNNNTKDRHRREHHHNHHRPSQVRSEGFITVDHNEGFFLKKATHFFYAITNRRQQKTTHQKLP